MPNAVANTRMSSGRGRRDYSFGVGRPSTASCPAASLSSAGGLGARNRAQKNPRSVMRPEVRRRAGQEEWAVGQRSVIPCLPPAPISSSSLSVACELFANVSSLGPSDNPRFPRVPRTNVAGGSSAVQPVDEPRRALSCAHTAAAPAANRAATCCLLASTMQPQTCGPRALRRRACNSPPARPTPHLLGGGAQSHRQRHLFGRALARHTPAILCGIRRAVTASEELTAAATAVQAAAARQAGGVRDVQYSHAALILTV
jgi:hypothetical protein